MRTNLTFSQWLFRKGVGTGGDNVRLYGPRGYFAWTCGLMDNVETVEHGSYVNVLTIRKWKREASNFLSGPPGPKNETAPTVRP